MNLNSLRERLLQRLISAVALQNSRVFLKLSRTGKTMKMDEQLIKSKKRISALWRRILHNKVINSAGRIASTKVKKSVFVDDQKYSDDSECDKENSSSEKASDEDLTKVRSYVMSSSPPCLPTILKKSQTDPASHQTPSSGRHATFKEIVKVHEYVVQDSIEYEEHYTSETSLTDEDEHAGLHKGFFVDNYPDPEDEEATPRNSTYARSSTRKLISDGERANIFRKLDGTEDLTEDSDEGPPEKSKSKNKKSSKSKSKKKKIEQELPDDMIFDFGC